MTPDVLTQIFDEVLACACQALDDFSACPCPCRKYVSAGRPAWDSCCPGDGQLTVHLERMYVAGNFPGANGASIVCNAPLAVEFVVTLLRCHPTVDENGNPPSSADLEFASNQIHTDLYVMLNALICCLAAKKKSQPFTVQSATILGPSGGCVGAEVRLAVQIQDPQT